MAVTNVSNFQVKRKVRGNVPATFPVAVNSGNCCHYSVIFINVLLKNVCSIQHTQINLGGRGGTSGEKALFITAD